MKHKLSFAIGLTLSLIFLMGLGIVSAQDEPPEWLSDTTNLCGEGDLLAGKCNVEGDEFLTQYLWDFGWYWKRVDEGDITSCEVPDFFGGFCIETTTLNLQTMIIIALQGSPFTGAAHVVVAGDDIDVQAILDANGIVMDGNDIVVIHGNDNANVITGTDGNDTIYGYAGNDTINGEDGDDIIYGGDESCTGKECNTDNSLGDTINGGDGDDIIYGGNESCSGNQCNVSYSGDTSNLGDTINGGDGDDIIYGGNESCSGRACNAAWGDSNVGDIINGGADDDTINGGNESCSGVAYCNASDDNGTTQLGDTINGETGADVINGGDETCTGTSCNDELDTSSNSNLGDIINQNDPANTPDGAVDNTTGGTENAASGSGNAADTCTTSGADGDNASDC